MSCDEILKNGHLHSLAMLENKVIFFWNCCAVCFSLLAASTLQRLILSHRNIGLKQCHTNSPILDFFPDAEFCTYSILALTSVLQSENKFQVTMFYQNHMA